MSLTSYQAAPPRDLRMLRPRGGDKGFLRNFREIVPCERCRAPARSERELEAAGDRVGGVAVAGELAVVGEVGAPAVVVGEGEAGIDDDGVASDLGAEDAEDLARAGGKLRVGGPGLIEVLVLPEDAELRLEAEGGGAKGGGDAGADAAAEGVGFVAEDVERGEGAALAEAAIADPGVLQFADRAEGPGAGVEVMPGGQRELTSPPSVSPRA